MTASSLVRAVTWTLIAGTLFLGALDLVAGMTQEAIVSLGISATLLYANRQWG